MEEPYAKQTRSHPLAKANFFSRIFFLYSFNSVRYDFYRDEVYSPLLGYRSELLGDHLERSWNKQKPNSTRKGNKSLLLNSILTAFWPELLKTIFVSFIEIFLRIAELACLSFVLSYFQANSTMSELNVVYWTIGMLAASCFRIFANAQQRCQTLYTSTKIRVACSNLVYRKVFRLKSKTLQEDAGNKIVSLISNDLSKCDLRMELINYVYTAPVVFIAVSYIMYQEFDFPGLVGIIFIILITVIQAFSAIYTSKLHFIANQLTDDRMKLMRFFLNSIYAIKIFVWEDSVAKLINKARTKELKIIGKWFLLKAISESVYICIVPICIFLALYTVILEREKITVVMVFVMIIYYTLLNYIVSIFFTLGLAKLLEIRNVLERVNHFLNLDELKRSGEKYNEQTDEVFIRLDNISATWTNVIETTESNEILDSTDSSEKTALLKAPQKLSGDNTQKIFDESLRSRGNFILRNISLSIEGNQFLAIIGPVGSGKTSLLQFILGSKVNFHRSTLTNVLCHDFRRTIHVFWFKKYEWQNIYAPQVAWTFTSSIRQNILFGLEYNEVRYTEVVRVCGLESDFRKFPEGDFTLVQNSGAHLNVGQIARINLARAVYQEADIYLLDDSFSEMDSQMANYVFNHCIMGFLKKKCRILVTSHISHVQNSDKIIYMENGNIKTEGCYEYVKDKGVINDDYKIVSTQNSNLEVLSEDCSIVKRDIFYRKIDRYSIKPIQNIEDASDNNSVKCQEAAAESHKADNVKNRKPFIFKYLLAGNNHCVLLTIVFLFVLNQIIMSSIFYYLGVWSSAEEIRHRFWFLSPVIFELFGLRSEQFYGNGFGILVLIFVIVALIKAYFFSKIVKADSKVIHENLLEKITNTYLKFYDITRSVQILSSFSKDLNIIDETLPKSIMESSQIVLMSLGSLVLLILVDTSFAVPTVILLLIFVVLLLLFSENIEKFRQTESQLLIPVLNHLSISSQGIVTSRALSAERVLVREFENHQDNYSGCWFLYGVYSIALSFYVDMSCFIFFSYIALVLVFRAKSLDISNGFVGMAFTQAIGLVGVIQYGIRQSLEVKHQLKAVERISRFSNLEKEEEPELRVEPPSTWPDQGNIVFDEVYLRYDTDSLPVLKNLCFVINSGEKIAIVGPTGAGKSSIIAALFRFVIVEGCIKIDGFDSRDISLEILRSKISVIPQKPILFPASLRFNLNPLEEYDDNVLYKALLALELKDLSGQLYNLDYEVQDGGSNFSVVERRLICLARALIRKNKILILDETTQRVDARIDELIKKTIRRHFHDCTVITITQQLNVAVVSDKVMVIESGKLQEFENPHVLLQNVNGKFYKMVSENGPSKAEKLQKLAFERYLEWTKP